MRLFLEIGWTGVTAARLHPLRSAVTVLCLCAVLVPYATATAISNGIRWEAQHSIDLGADIYVSAIRFGRPAPLPLSVAMQIETIDGVVGVTPRTVSEVLLGKDQIPAVLVGLPIDRLQKTVDIVEGRLPQKTAVHELVIGSELAKRLKLEVGSYLPPFYRSGSGERVSKVVGVFHTNAPFWQANLVVTTLDAAGAIFDQSEFATELLVDCRPGYASRVRESILQVAPLPSGPDHDPSRLRVITRDDLNAYLPRGLNHRDGIINLHVVLLLIASMLVVLVTSGVGLSERSREIGILKATGWQTDEVLLRSFAESLVIAMLGSMSSLLVSFIWLRVFNGAWIASVFISGLSGWSTATIPYRLLPIPVLITIVLSLTITMTGSLYSTWRSAVASPSAAMRS